MKRKWCLLWQEVLCQLLFSILVVSSLVAIIRPHSER